jgi:hypothetical protein
VEIRWEKCVAGHSRMTARLQVRKTAGSRLAGEFITQRQRYLGLTDSQSYSPVS